MTLYRHTMGVGQSLAVGNGGQVSGAVPDTARMLTFGGTGAPATYTAPADKEPPLRQLVEQVVEHAGAGYYMTVNNHAIGASLYSDLKKGGAKPAFAESMERLADAQAWCVANGHTVVVRTIDIIHGEGDQGIGNTAYADNLDEWLADYDADSKSITGQTDDVLGILCQLGSSADSIIARAQLAAHRNNPNFYLACPKYQLPYADTLHLTSAGFHYLGELHARAHNAAVVDGDGWQPVHPRKVTVVGNTVVVDFHVPVAPLVFDTTTVAGQTNMGFSVHNTDGPTLSSVAITGARQVTLTLSGAPGGSTTVGYGRTSASGNLRDSETAVSELDGEPLANWAVHFNDPVGYDDGTLTAGSGALRLDGASPSVARGRQNAADRTISVYRKNGVEITVS